MSISKAWMIAAALAAAAVVPACQRDGRQRAQAAAPISGPVQVVPRGQWNFFPPPPELLLECIKLAEANRRSAAMFGRLRMSPLDAARRGAEPLLPSEQVSPNMAGVLLATMRAAPVSHPLSPNGGTLRLRLEGTKADAALIIDWSYQRDRLIIESLQVENVQTAERIEIVAAAQPGDGA